MILSVNKTLGVKCPVCNQNVLTKFTPFDINYDCAAVCSVCNKRFSSIKKGRNDKYIISAECYICEETHTYEISSKSIWKSDLFALACHTSGIDICYIGDKNKVKNALDTLDDSLDEMTNELAGEVVPELTDIMKEGLAAIDRIAYNGKIDCLCGKCDLALRLCRTGITITCLSCGASEFIKIETPEDLREIKTRKSIKLI